VSDTLMEWLLEDTDPSLTYPLGRDGGVNYARTVEYSDICINGMLLAIAGRFIAPTDAGIAHARIRSIVDYLLERRMADGGRNNEIRTAIATGVEFILRHQLLRSERTGEVIRDEFFRYTFPVRWKYDILRCLDLFRQHGVLYDPRMGEALDRIEKARRPGGYWNAASQPGKTYFVIEPNSSPGRWNTLRALRTLRCYGRLP